MSGGKAWTAEELALLRELWPTERGEDVAARLGRTYRAVISKAKVLGLRKAEGYDRSWKNRAYGAEDDAWFRAYVPGHTEAEISAEHERLFGWPLTESQIGNRKARLGVRSGTRGGQFPRGHVPANKGRAWEEFGTPEGHARSRATQFRAGNEPHNAVPLLSTRVSKDGIPEVKVRTHPREGRHSPDCWEPLGILNWEQANGREWPEGCRCMYADHDPAHCTADNVVPVPKELYAIVNGSSGARQLEYHDRESLELAVAYARVISERRRLAKSARVTP